MKLHRIIGQVTLSRGHAGYANARLLLAEPEGWTAIGGPRESAPDLIVVWDDLGAGEGSRVAVSDGAEAAQPFRPELKAVDAYNAAIIDCVHVDPRAVARIQFDQPE
ncbi:MAG: carbon dioxide concentrating mechanism protein CcmL [Planctomycetota bacterium]|nr:MAG: carbon dioxide concentrating mechanism protein CcmL [Planctomycetota bacterium]